MVGHAGAQEVVDAREIHARLRALEAEKLLDLGGEGEPARPCDVIERLDAEPVARGEERPSLAIPQHESEHAAKTIERRLAPDHIGAQQHLGVRARREGLASGLELGSAIRDSCRSRR